MQSTVETLEGLNRRLTVSIPANVMSSKYQSRLAKVSNTARLDGFRPGKVPAKVIESRFGQGIRLEVIGELLDESFRSVVEEKDLKIASTPKVDEPLPEWKKGEDFSFSATFETYPEVTLKEIDGETIECKTATVSDEDVSAVIEKLRKQHAEMILAERPAQKGDQVVIDFEGFMDGKPFEGGKATEFTLELGSKQMIPGFEEGLLAAGNGDETTLELSFPADYHVAELAGKPVEFKVHVHRVMTPQALEDDEALAKKLNIEGGAEALLKDARDNMERECERAISASRKEAVMDKLLALNSIEVPQSLVHEEAHHLQHQEAERMRYMMGGKDVPKELLPPVSTYEENAKKRVSLGLIVAEVIKAHDIKVDQDRVRAKIEDMSKNYQDSAQMVDWYYKNKELLGEMESAVLEDQVVDVLLEKAATTDKSVSYDELVNPGNQA